MICLGWAIKQKNGVFVMQSNSPRFLSPAKHTSILKDDQRCIWIYWLGPACGLVQ
jgi:hypothetical protein